jgi:mannose-6-phosphate isomerase-like protein (cupin superfamily)
MMGAHTVVNLEQLPNAAARFGAGLEQHAGSDPLGLQNFGLALQRLAPQFRIPFGHDHEHTEEVYVVVGGSARAKIGEEVIELDKWDAVRIPTGTPRQFEAGPAGVEMVIVGAPRGPDDSEILHGWWQD